jgi:hypothetical protein
MIDQDILDLDLDPIAFKLKLDEDWSLEEIDAGIMDYRAMLQLIRNADGQSVAPSPTIDTVWHHHILDTRKYIDDCMALFGRYIHHYPYSGVFGEDDAREQHARYERSCAAIRAIVSKIQTQPGV